MSQPMDMARKITTALIWALFPRPTGAMSFLSYPLAA